MISGLSFSLMGSAICKPYHGLFACIELKNPSFRAQAFTMCRCNGGVNFTMQRDSSKALRYAALQSEAGKKLLQRCGRRPDDISSIVFVEPDACFIKSEAVLRIAQKLDQPFPALASSLLPLPGLIRDAVYDQVNFSSARGHLQGLRPNDAAELPAVPAWPEAFMQLSLTLLLIFVTSCQASVSSAASAA